MPDGSNSSPGDSSSGPSGGTVISTAGTYSGSSGDDLFIVNAQGVSLNAAGGDDTAWVKLRDQSPGATSNADTVSYYDGASWVTLAWNASNTVIESYLGGYAAASQLAFWSGSTSGSMYSGFMGVTSVERLNVDAGTGYDMVVYRAGGTRYLGGADTDKFVADWSGQTTGLTFDLSANATTSTSNTYSSRLT